MQQEASNSRKIELVFFSTITIFTFQFNRFSIISCLVSIDFEQVDIFVNESLLHMAHNVPGGTKKKHFAQFIIKFHQ